MTFDFFLNNSDYPPKYFPYLLKWLRMGHIIQKKAYVVEVFCFFLQLTNCIKKLTLNKYDTKQRNVDRKTAQENNAKLLN